MVDFDFEVQRLDEIENETFGSLFTVTGLAEPISGIIDFGPQEFEGVTSTFVTIEVFISDIEELEDFDGVEITEISSGTKYMINNIQPFTKTKVILEVA